MKKFIKVSAIIFLVQFIVSASAMAVPITGDALQDFFDSKGWGLNAEDDQMTANHSWSLTNASGASHMVFYHENPSDISFGIYSSAGLQEVTVFDDKDTPVAMATVSFDAGNILVVQYWDAGGLLISNAFHAFSGENFGFWIADDTNKYYSNEKRNDVNNNNIFGEEEDIALLVYNADPGSYVFAGDIDGNGTFANIVTQAESIHPSPEPASMVLLGIGLLGLAGLARKKIISSN
jgi:hypothetical protein